MKQKSPDNLFVQDAGRFCLVETIGHCSRYAYHYQQLTNPLISSTKNISTTPRSKSDKPRIHKLAQRLEPNQIQDIIRRYRAGESSNAIAVDLCISKGAVLNLLDAHQVTKRSRSVSEEQKQRIRQLRHDGLTLKQIAKETGHSYRFVQQYLAKV